MNGQVLVIIGIVLLAAAWISVGGIPREADQDFGRFVQSRGGSLASTPGFPDLYRQMSANSRMMQNFYVGGVGLICLAVGLAGRRRQPKSEDTAETKPR